MVPRFQFSLRTLFLGMAAVAAFLVIGVPLIDLAQLWRQNRAVQRIEEERERIWQETADSYYANRPAPALPTIDAEPSTFLSDIERLISHGRYTDATRLLKAASATKQLAYAIENSDYRYLAVAEDAIYFPGLADIAADEHEYWLFPGTSDVIEDFAWQQAVTSYAATYNRQLATSLLQQKPKK